MKHIGLLLLAAAVASGQQGAPPQQKKVTKTGLTPQDWRYKLRDGVTSRGIIYYSEGTAC